MQIRSWRSILSLCLLLLAACVEPYAPEVIEAPNRFLVVDGFINSGGTTTFKLSRSQNLTDDSLPAAETSAVVAVEQEQGPQTELQEVEPGTYTAETILDPAQRYRLTIRTADGKSYASDYVPVKQTPPIDAVTWTTDGSGLHFFVDTHDPAGNTRYYRWEYEGTWSLTAAFYTGVKYDKASGEVVPRTRSDEDIYHCWKTDVSTDIKLATSGKLSSDVIHAFPMLTLPPNAEQLRFKYSLLVKQYALTQEAYQYWETLRKNTENIGTLFDPLPTQLTGNVHNLADAAEPVIGYVGASTVKEKRIFVDNEELPGDWRSDFPTCPLDSLLPVPPEQFEDLAGRFTNENYVPVSIIYTPMGMPKPIGYTAAAKQCIDCRFRGTNVKPAFWED